MSTLAHAPAVLDLSELRLDAARALVAQSLGHELPAHAGGPLGYLQSLIDSLCELSLKDPLTGLSNRRHLHSAMESELDRVTRSGEAALLLIIDIDHFKNVNDTYGHPAGDTVLQAVGRTLQSCLRPMDTVARFGGEEFAIILPDCHLNFGRTTAERLRSAIEAELVPVSPTKSLGVTVSIGGAFTLQWVRSTAALWLDRADVELYKAKQGGRNRVCIENQPDSTVSAEEKDLLFASPVYTRADWGEATSPQSVSSTGSAY